MAGYVAEGPGMSVYALEDGAVYRTYVATARGSSRARHGLYALLDRNSVGRNEPPDEPLWIRRHNEYETA